jgi:hypothetical protein
VRATSTDDVYPRASSSVPPLEPLEIADDPVVREHPPVLQKRVRVRQRDAARVGVAEVRDELARLRVARDPAVDAIAGRLDGVADQQQRGLSAERRDPEAVGMDLTLRGERRRRLQQPELGLDVLTSGMQCEQTTHVTATREPRGHRGSR